MQKNIFIELVYNEAHANRPSTDFVVLKSDINAYLPAAVNFALTKGFYTQKNQEGNGDIPTTFYSYFNDLEVLEDSTRKNRKYFVLPKPVVALPSNRGVRAVTDNCDNYYTELNDRDLPSIKHWLKTLPDERFYNIQDKNVYLYNPSTGTRKMNLIAIVEASEIEDTDTLSIPAGLEVEAIQICAELVLGVRQLNVDRKNDGRSIN